MGGSIFGGTNSADFTWTNEGKLGTTSEGVSFAEPDAWIWNADNTKPVQTYVGGEGPNGEKVIAPIKVNLNQQIRNSAKLPIEKRRKFVRQLLYGEFLIEWGIGYDRKGNQYTPGRKPVDGPYKIKE